MLFVAVRYCAAKGLRRLGIGGTGEKGSWNLLIWLKDSFLWERMCCRWLDVVLAEMATNEDVVLRRFNRLYNKNNKIKFG